MRDEGRIEEILDIVRQIWLSNPDLRLGQIVVNAAAAASPIEPCPQIFGMEDSRMLKGLRRYVELTNRGGRKESALDAATPETD